MFCHHLSVKQQKEFEDGKSLLMQLRLTYFQKIAVETKLTQGMGGTVFCDKYVVYTGQ